MTETTLVKWGNGQGIRLSRGTVEEAGLAIGDRMRVEARGDGSILLTPERRKKIVIVPNFSELFEGYEGPWPSEDGSGDPVGAERI